MVKEEKKVYLEHILGIDKDDIRKELERICKEANVNKNLVIFLDTGGPRYVIDQIASEIFLSESEINEDVRFKLRTLEKVIDFKIKGEIGDIFYLKKRIKGEEYEYFKETLIEKLKEVKKEIISQIIGD